MSSREEVELEPISVGVASEIRLDCEGLLYDTNDVSGELAFLA